MVIVHQPKNGRLGIKGKKYLHSDPSMLRDCPACKGLGLISVIKKIRSETFTKGLLCGMKVIQLEGGEGREFNAPIKYLITYECNICYGEGLLLK